MALFEQPLRFGTSGSVFETSVDPGSMLFGGAGRSNSLGQERDGTKGGLFGDKANVLDWFGSPITAGTNSQGLARGAATLWGLWALAGLGGGSAAASEGGSEGGTALGGGAGEAGGGSGWGDYLRWGQRGYNAYNMLQGGGPLVQLLRVTSAEFHLLAYIHQLRANDLRHHTGTENADFHVP